MRVCARVPYSERLDPTVRVATAAATATSVMCGVQPSMLKALGSGCSGVGRPGHANNAGSSYAEEGRAGAPICKMLGLPSASIGLEVIGVVVCCAQTQQVHAGYTQGI